MTRSRPVDSSTYPFVSRCSTENYFNEALSLEICIIIIIIILAISFPLGEVVLHVFHLSSLTAQYRSNSCDACVWVRPLRALPQHGDWVNGYVPCRRPQLPTHLFTDEWFQSTDEWWNLAYKLSLALSLYNLNFFRAHEGYEVYCSYAQLIYDMEKVWNI